MELEPTFLYLPSSDKSNLTPTERLYLPRRDSAPCFPLDEYLSRIPSILSRANELLASCQEEEEDMATTTEHPVFVSSHNMATQFSQDRCLHVLQGELAHASALQTDVVVSAEATTCHVVALRSTSNHTTSVPLVSLAHVDQPHVYDTCLEAMVLEHVLHHTTPSREQEVLAEQEESAEDFGFFIDEDEQNEPEELSPQEQEEDPPHFLPGLDFDRKSSSLPAALQHHHTLGDDDDCGVERKIEMELHLLGGFLDEDGTSQDLSNSLLMIFSQLAEKYQNKLRISLSTAAISCMNTHGLDGRTAPRSRGMGIDIRTGEVFPVKTVLPAHLEGPALEIRSARAWAEQTKHTLQHKESLHVIHDRSSCGGEVRVQPFRYEPVTEFDILLAVSDEVLLQHTSTSPASESGRFCSDLRRTLSFVNTVPAETIFGKDCSQPLVYARSASNLNEWEVVKPIQKRRSQSIAE
jgi:hypothetical protein